MRFKLLPIVRQLLLAIMAVFALQAPAAAEPLVDAKQVEAWADKYYGRAIAEKRSSGMVISVVQDGKLIFAKGYGHADLGRRIPVDPETTGFQVGSITKTFIATSVGQLVDRGQIKSLDDPVNRYLKRVKLRGERGARVTIRQLLNHRAGFEDINFGYLNNSRNAKVPLSASEIQRYMPEISMEPGGFANYSNWGFSLLGFMIEDITGQRIDHYLRDNIWRPLGMTHTSMNLGKAPANGARAYKFEKDGTPVPSRIDEPHPWIGPAGTIVSTAGDMARYMNAHILEGEDGGYPLLSKAMFRELHTESYRNAPASFGFAHTFWVSQLNGSPSIEHGGGTPSFQNMMLMIPGKRFGFYISAMDGGLVPWAEYSEDEIKSGKIAIRGATTGFELRESFIDAFLKRTGEVNQVAARQSPKLPLSAFPGTYWGQRRNFSTIESLVGAFNPASVLTVTLSDDGKGLMLNGYGPYTEVANGVFASKTASNVWKDPYTIDYFKPAYIAFNVDADGKVRGMIPGLGDQIWVPASPIFNPQSMMLGAMVFGIAVLTGLLLFAWPQAGRFTSYANYAGLGATLCLIAFPLVMMVGFAKDDDLIAHAATGQYGRFWVMIAAANLMVVAAVALVVGAVRQWMSPRPAAVPGWAGLGYRLHLSIVAAAACGMLVVFGFFNFLGINMPG